MADNGLIPSTPHPQHQPLRWPPLGTSRSCFNHEDDGSGGLRQQQLSPNLSLFLNKLFCHGTNAERLASVSGGNREYIKTLQSPFAFIFQSFYKLFIPVLLQCFLVVVSYCFHFKWNHPHSVRTRKPNNSPRLDFARGKAKPTGELGPLQGAQTAQQQRGLQTLLRLVLLRPGSQPQSAQLVSRKGCVVWGQEGG